MLTTNGSGVASWQDGGGGGVPSTSTSFSPALRGGTTAGTYTISNNASYYTQIGPIVFINMSFSYSFTVAGAGTGDLQITGMPVTSSNDTNSESLFTFIGDGMAASAEDCLGVLGPNSTVMTVEKQNNVSRTVITITSAVVDGKISISGFYRSA